MASRTHAARRTAHAHASKPPAPKSKTPVTVTGSDTARGAPSEPEANASQKGVELGLFAPYNKKIQLIGSWTDWKPVDLERGEDGWWRTRVELKDGDYHYKFRVESNSFFSQGQTVDVFDPYALSITNDVDENTILRVRDGKRVDVAYAWKHDDKPLPVNRDLVIYEMHVGDFTGGHGDHGKGQEYEKGQLKHVIDKLDYLKDLGVNCIELMPVKEFPGKGWGYSLRSLFAVDSSYGPPEDLCRLIDEAHGKGIRVVIDGVYNHAEEKCPLALIDFQFWFHHPNPDPEMLQWGPKFNYAYYDEKLGVFPARKYVTESIRFWVETFHIDGVRFDATRAIADFKILRELTDVAHEKADGIKAFFTVAEHVPEDPAITNREAGAPMDSAWHDGYARLLQAIVIGKEIDGLPSANLDKLAEMMDLKANGYQTSDRLVNFIGNHDFKRILYLLGEDAKVFDDAAFRRVKLGTALLFASPGLPMLWMGQEFGFSSEKTLDPRPLDWTLLKNQRNADLLQFHKNLIAARKEYAALRADGLSVVLEDQERLVFGFKRFDDEGNVAVVVGNLKDTRAGDFEIAGVDLQDGSWHEVVFNYDVRVEGGVLRDALGESEVKIFVRKGD